MPLSLKEIRERIKGFQRIADEVLAEKIIEIYENNWPEKEQKGFEILSSNIFSINGTKYEITCNQGGLCLDSLGRLKIVLESHLYPSNPPPNLIYLSEQDFDRFKDKLKPFIRKI